MNEEIIDKIERYLNEQLSQTERSEFENELQANIELQKQVEFMRNLPKAVKAHTEDALRLQLKEIEKQLPEVEFEPEEEEVAIHAYREQRSLGSKRAMSAQPRIEQAPPKSISSSNWVRYAVAASILLFVGVFLFRDEIFNGRENQNQVAQNGNDTLNTHSQVNQDKEKRVAVSSLNVTRIEDGKFGFVKNGLEKKLILVQEVDPTLLNEYEGVNGVGPRAMQMRPGVYRLMNDTLFIRTGKLQTVIQVFDLDVKAQRSQMVDSLGQIIEYDKPALQGLFIMISIDFFKIEKVENYSPLIQVKKSELQLLKFYTK
jgi:hypothetical protein